MRSSRPPPEPSQPFCAIFSKIYFGADEEGGRVKNTGGKVAGVAVREAVVGVLELIKIVDLAGEV